MKVRNSFLLYFIVTTILSLKLVAGNPIQSPNPWKDDYRDISSLENYKSWGTYNVHDPAVMKVGDTYYMYSTDAIYF